MSATTTVTVLGALMRSRRRHRAWSMDKVVERTDFTFVARNVSTIEVRREKVPTLRNVVSVARALVVRFFQRNRERRKYQGRKCQGTRP